MKKTVELIRAPFDLGASRRGAARGPDALLAAGLEDRLRGLGWTLFEEPAGGEDATSGGKPVFSRETSADRAIKHLPETAAFAAALAARVSAAARSSRFPLVLGGDHSVAIGTLAGLADVYKRLGVIWIDAHGDLNTEATSPSGNIHGMALAASLGHGHPLLTGIRTAGAKLRPEHTVIVGARSLDPGERAAIRSFGVGCYTMHDIDRLGMPRVMEEAIRRVSSGTDGVHLSFDIDSVDPVAAPGTGTPVPGGLSYREAHLALELLFEAGIVTSAEFVELNPGLDTDGRTAELAVGLIGSLLGQQIL